MHTNVKRNPECICPLSRPGHWYGTVCAGRGEVPGVHLYSAAVEADPSPVLLGADVVPLLPAGLAASLPLR